MSGALQIALMLESDGPGGAEVMLLELARELRRRGHGVHPIGPERGQGWLGQKLRDEGFETHTFLLRSFLDWRCVRRLADLLRRLRVDVLHGHEFDGAVYGTLAARRCGRPSVITLHGNAAWFTSAWRRRAALRWAFRRSRGVAVVSEATKRKLDKDLDLGPKVTTVIRNGVAPRDGTAGRIRDELGLAPGEALILAVGNLLELKGHIVLLQALQRLRAGGFPVPWRLAIAGGYGGPERPRLDAFLAEHGLAERVHILSFRDDIPDLQAAADVFVLPSYREGFPMSLVEAMFAGTAVIASDVGGIPEAITPEEHGLLVPPGDADALAAALERLLRAPAERARLAGRARERALREFSVEAMTSAYESLYRRT